MHRIVLLSSALAVLLSGALQAQDQDTLTLGRVTSAPGVVRVPVYLRVVGQTAFNPTAGIALQGITFRVNFGAGTRISSARVDRTGSGGLLSDLTPIMELAPGTAGSISYVGLFEEKIPAVFDAPAPGQKIMDLVFAVEPGGGQGAIALEFDRETSTLSNQGGTVLENANGRGLSLVSGSIEIDDLPQRHVGPRVERRPRK